MLSRPTHAQYRTKIQIFLSLMLFIPLSSFLLICARDGTQGLIHHRLLGYTPITLKSQEEPTSKALVVLPKKMRGKRLNGSWSTVGFRYMRNHFITCCQGTISPTQRWDHDVRASWSGSAGECWPLLVPCLFHERFVKLIFSVSESLNSTTTWE